jgi:hypothetical protein
MVCLQGEAAGGEATIPKYGLLEPGHELANLGVDIVRSDLQEQGWGPWRPLTWPHPPGPLWLTTPTRVCPPSTSTVSGPPLSPCADTT